MAKQNILVGASANDKAGDTLRNAFVKVNANFTELYTLTGGTSADLQELAQDYAAPMFNHASHVNITAAYDDANNKILLTGVASAVWPVTNTAGASGPAKVAIGANAGLTSQGPFAVAIGASAGYVGQSTNTVAVGVTAGETNQGISATAVGASAGNEDQGVDAVAVGGGAGQITQGEGAVAVGASAGATNQGSGTVAVGIGAGNLNQGVGAVAVGINAGSSGQGVRAIAIGQGAGETNQPANTIILNASGSTVNGVASQTNSFYVSPIRSATATSDVLYYNTTTKEVTYGTAFTGTGNVGFRNDTIFDLAGLAINNSNTSTASTAGISIPANGSGTLSITNSSSTWGFGSTGNTTFPTGLTLGAPRGPNTVNFTSAIDKVFQIETQTDSTGKLWNFGTDGWLTLPANGVVQANTIIALSSFNDTNNIARVLCQSISNTPQVNLRTITSTGAQKDWVFASTGALTLPNGATLESVFNSPTDPVTALRLNSPGGGTAQLFLIVNNNQILVDNNGVVITGGSNSWEFGSTGLTLPLNTVINETASSPGLTRTKYSGTFVLDPTWFVTNAGNLIETTTINGTIQLADVVETAFSFQYFGYFVPPTSANYTFRAHADETFVFWIGAKALSGYTYANKDMYGNYNGTFPEQQTQSFTIALTAGQFYPIRIQWANSAGWGELDVFTWANDIGQVNTSNFTGRIYTANTGTAKISANDNKSIILSTDNATDNNWTFAPNGLLTFPDATIQETAFQDVASHVFFVHPNPGRTFTATGTYNSPFATITAAINAAVAAGHSDSDPATIILLANITENVTLKPGIWLTSLGTGTHGSPTITGTVTVTSSTGTTVTNHYSLSYLRIVAPTNGHCINFTGTAPQKLFIRDLWLDANGTGDGVYMDNTGSGSTVQFDIGHLAHSGTGDIYCINVTKGSCYVTDIETTGATQVAAVQTGAVLTIDGSELVANGDIVCETYGTGTLTITNSIITNTLANSTGVKINDAGGTVTIGNNLITVPAGTGYAVQGPAGGIVYHANNVFTTNAYRSTGLGAGFIALPTTWSTKA
jgi:hypothetical protein